MADTLYPADSNDLRPEASPDAPTLRLGQGAENQPPRLRYFGDYELLTEIARGGMGVVYRARQMSLNRTVAVKMILAGQLAGSADVQRFRLEAQAAANLDHPNIVPIYEVGEHEGMHYFSMKLVEGESLRQALPAMQKDHRHAAQLLVSIARAVHYAHQCGILHRDLKPANILIDQSGHARITDFGLAKRMESDSDLTRSGAILGTPAYMAPEQARADKIVTTAVDVYSLGAILFELLADRPPFVGETSPAILLAVLSEEAPRLRIVCPDAGIDLETICEKCLRKQPAARYESAGALADDVERWLRGEPILARPATPLERLRKWVRRRPSVAALIGVSALAAILLLVTLLVTNARISTSLANEKAAGKESRERLVHGLLRRATDAFEQGDVGAALVWRAAALREETDLAAQHMLRARLSLNLEQMPPVRAMLPLGDVLAFNAEESELTSVGEIDQRMSAGTRRRMSGSTLVRTPVIDGTSVQQTVRMTDPAPARTIEEFQSGLSSETISMSISGSVGRIAVGKAEGGATMLRFWDVRATKPLGRTPSLQGEITHVTFSSDGSRAAVLLEAGDANVSRDYAIRCFEVSSGGELGHVIEVNRPKDSSITFPIMNRTGALLAFGWAVGPSSRQPGAEVMRAEVREVDTGKSHFVAPPPQWRDFMQVNASSLQLAFSPNGGRLLTLWETHRHTVARVWNLRSGTPETNELLLPGLRGSYWNRSPNVTAWFTPDGRNVAFEHEHAVCLYDAASGFPGTQIMLPDASVNISSVSPDGKQVAILATNRHGPAVRVFRTDTGELVLPRIYCGGPVQRMFFTRSGRQLAITTARDSLGSKDAVTQVRDLVTAGRDIFRPPQGWKPVALSGDGKRVVVRRALREGPVWQEVQVFDIASGTAVGPVCPLSLSDGGSMFALSRDGGKLAALGYTSTGGKTLTAMHLLDVRTGKSELPPGILNDVTGDVPAKELGTVSLWFDESDKWVITHAEGENGRTFLTAWDRATGRALQLRAPEAEDFFNAAALSGDGTRALVARNTQSSPAPRDARVWDVVERKPISPEINVKAVEHAALSPDGSRVLIQEKFEKRVAMFDAVTAKELWKLDKIEAGALGFSNDNTRVAIWSEQDIRVMNAVTGLPISPAIRFRAFHKEQSVMRFSNDGSTLIAVTGFNTGEAGIWDARTGDALCPPLVCDVEPHEPPVFAWHDGRVLIQKDGALSAVDLRPDERPIGIIEAHAQLLSGRKLAASGTLIALSKDELLEAWQRVNAYAKAPAASPVSQSGSR